MRVLARAARPCARCARARPPMLARRARTTAPSGKSPVPEKKGRVPPIFSTVPEIFLRARFMWPALELALKGAFSAARSRLRAKPLSRELLAPFRAVLRGWGGGGARRAHVCLVRGNVLLASHTTRVRAQVPDGHNAPGALAHSAPRATQPPRVCARPTRSRVRRRLLLVAGEPRRLRNAHAARTQTRALPAARRVPWRRFSS